MPQTFESIVIGAGQSGIPLAERLAAAGQKTALIEMNDIGGTCVNTGCIPSKTVIASARVAHLARRAADFGVEVGPVRVDFAKVMSLKNHEVLSRRERMTARLESTPNLTLIRGKAEFTGPHRVTVNGETLEAAQFILNMGSRAVLPNLPAPYMTNKELLALTELPEHLIILGGSYIGLEFGQAFRRLGSQVTIIENQAHIMSREDYDISEIVRRVLEREGVQILVSAKVARIEEAAQGRITVWVEHDGHTTEITGSHLLAATGRRPNTDNIGLDIAGVQMNERGYVTVDDRLQTSRSHIWAMGEINGQGAFTHTSYNDYEILEDVLFGADERRLSHRIPTYGVFVDPPLGRVGMNERQARELGKAVLMATLPMEDINRARVRHETDGLIKVLVDPQTERFLGASVLGIEGDEVVASFTNLIYAGAPYTTLQRAVHIHPTVTELLPTLLGRLKPLV